MSVAEEYRKIYKKEICGAFKQEIAIYNEEDEFYVYQPLSHNCANSCTSGCNHDCYKRLGLLMRKNIIFYCYGEEEIVTKFKKGSFQDLEKATKSAYRLRLPKRQPKQDGLLSEVLLDTIIQSILPDAYKMAVRTIFRQNDNNEIKGYDLTYFTNQDGEITLWLGQAKLGSKQYCKDGILEDLKTKYEKLYMAKQIYFLADKPMGLTEEGKRIADLLDDLNMLNADESDEKRAERLMQFLGENNIKVCVPCLLAYEKKEIYRDISKLKGKVESEIKWAKKVFKENVRFNDIKPRVVFIIFPLDNVDELRGDEGFYAGLC